MPEDRGEPASGAAHRARAVVDQTPYSIAVGSKVRSLRPNPCVGIEVERFLQRVKWTLRIPPKHAAEQTFPPESDWTWKGARKPPRPRPPHLRT
jgi:hypothetical protein